MTKNILLETINKQRKLMGLNELLDANVNVDLGIVPLEEINPNDTELANDPDAQEMADSDEIDLDDVNSHPDEEDFYTQKSGENFADRMDREHPDPNEMEYYMNRYTDIENFTGGLNEGLGNRIGQFFKNSGNTWKLSKAIDKWQKQTKAVKKDFDQIAKLINNVAPKMDTANQFFQTVNTLGNNQAGFDTYKHENDVLNKSFNSAREFGNAYQQMSQQIVQAQTAANNTSVQQTNQLAGQLLNQAQTNPNQSSQLDPYFREIIQRLADQGQQNSEMFRKIDTVLKSRKNTVNANNPNRSPTQADNDHLNQMAADQGLVNPNQVNTAPVPPVPPVQPKSNIVPQEPPKSNVVPQEPEYTENPNNNGSKPLVNTGGDDYEDNPENNGSEPLVNTSGDDYQEQPNTPDVNNKSKKTDYYKNHKVNGSGNTTISEKNKNGK